MAKSFTNEVSLHRLLETAPLNALESFLATVDGGRYRATFAALSWPPLSCVPSFL
jgi:hypothetical protein